MSRTDRMQVSRRREIRYSFYQDVTRKEVVTRDIVRAHYRERWNSIPVARARRRTDCTRWR
jgi:hypothetical protein